MRITFILIIGIVLGCKSPQGKENDKSEPKENQIEEEQAENKSLLDHVKLAINPQFNNWVLFENGTYIIFDNVDTIKNIELSAIEKMKEYGPVYPGGPAGDFSVTKLTRTEGWVVSSWCYGMYTYVNPKELSEGSPSDVKIGLKGRSKRALDGENPIIKYVCSKGIVKKNEVN